MKKIFLYLLLLIFGFQHTSAQTPLSEAIDFSAKTLEGNMIYLFELLDEGKIVVVNFYSTTCGPCQTYSTHFQQAFEIFGQNVGNVFFVNMNMNDYNIGVEIFNNNNGITLPSVSGLEGGGDKVYEAYDVLSYPTVIVITPDHLIFDPHVFLPTTDNIVEAVIAAGGTMVWQGEVSAAKPLFRAYQTGTAVLQIEYVADHTADGQVKVFDMAGRMLLQTQQLIIHQGFNTFSITSDIQKTGIYIVEFTIDHDPPGRQLVRLQ
jgi:thiol-disulfide isomerase/thioredoxin